MAIRILVSILVGSLTAVSLAADEAVCDASEVEAPETIFEEQVLVTGGSDIVETLPGSADFVDLEVLEEQSYGDVNRILRAVPGVNIQEEEGYGLRPNIGMRGTGVERSAKITVLEDGVLIAPAPYAAPAAYYFPTSARMEALEVWKGSAAISQGPYTTGGVLNLVSSTIPPRLAAAAEVFYGSDSTLRVRAKAGDSSNRYGWLVETFQLDTEGFKELDGGGPTGVRLQDYLSKLRLNSGASASLYQLLELKLGKTDQFGEETYLGLTQDDFERKPLRRYAGSQEDWIDTDHEQYQLRYFVQPSSSVYLTTTIYRNDFLRNWHKLQSVAGVGISAVLEDPLTWADELDILRGELDDASGSLKIRNNRRTYRSEGVDMLLDWQVSTASIEHQVQFGWRLHRDFEDRYQEEDAWSMIDGRMRFESLGPPASQANRIDEAQALALFVRDSLFLGRWTVAPGFRVEDVDFLRRDFGRQDPGRSGHDLVRKENGTSAVLPGVGITYQAAPAWNLVAGVHRGFAPPGPGQDPETEAEESWNYELGVRWGRRASQARAVAFYTDYDNLLGRDTLASGGDGTGDAFNGGAAEVIGLEASFEHDAGMAAGWRIGVPVRVAYTFTRGRFLSSFATSFPDWAPQVEAGDELPYLPEHQLNVSGGIVARRWSGYLNLSFVDAMRSSPGQGPIPAGEGSDQGFVVDASLGYSLRENLALRLQVRNLMDEIYVVARRPAGARPGLPRALLIGIDWDL